MEQSAKPPWNQAPSDARYGQEIAEVAPREGGRVAGLGADVVVGIDIVDQRADRAVARRRRGGRIGWAVAERQRAVLGMGRSLVAACRFAQHAVDVAHHQVQMAAGRLARHGREEVVADREMLGVIP
jgi:hypothetical protein